MANKRQINYVVYDVAELVKNAIASVDGRVLDLENARDRLALLGNKCPNDALVARYARESAILKVLALETDNPWFTNQIGKIDFSCLEQAIASVHSYLSRRVAGQHARWTSQSDCKR
jgi:hypothetical protein